MTLVGQRGGNNRSRRDGGKGKDGKYGGKAGGKPGSGRALGSPRVVDPSQMPPKSDPSARAAYMLQEWHACNAQAQQGAQQPATPLPPESWAAPPPPPAYGAPPPGAGQAQASYYQPQQWPVPDSQPLGDQSSPWGPQVPWEADAWGFLAFECGVDESCSSVSGFGRGTGAWALLPVPLRLIAPLMRMRACACLDPVE